MEIEYRTYKRPRIAEPVPAGTAEVTTGVLAVQYVYQVSSSDSAPTPATGGQSNNSYVPTGWNTAVQPFTATNVYSWRSTRTYDFDNTQWNDFQEAERWESTFYVPYRIGTQDEHDNYVAVVVFTDSIVGTASGTAGFVSGGQAGTVVDITPAAVEDRVRLRAGDAHFPNADWIVATQQMRVRVI